jgi:plasmid maintenance system antidote protein VapI
MRLVDFLKKEGIQKTAFARSMGISRSMVNQIISGKKTPSLELAQRIQRITLGKVRADEWETKRRTRADSMRIAAE